MRLLFASEARFETTPDGAVWALGAWGPGLWDRYLRCFDTVRVMARLSAVTTPSEGLVRIGTPDVTFDPIQGYTGLTGYLRQLRRIDDLARAGVQDRTAVIVRMPSPIGFRVARQAIRSRRSYGVEVVGDPDQVFAKGVVDHPVRPFLRIEATRAQKRLCMRAAAALYVTERILQAKYPTRGRAFAASDVELDQVVTDRSATIRNSAPTLITVASLEQPYKGISVLLHALAALHGRGVTPQLCVVGGGRLQPSLEAEAERLGILPAVDFAGQLPSSAINAALDRADLFVLPSLTEGLPRALLEAMARGLPAVATAVGGVSELLPAEFLVVPGDAESLAQRIEALLNNADLRRAAAEANARRAADFDTNRLTGIRREFLECVREDASRPYRAL